MISYLKLKRKSKIVVISPHLDDEVLGLGGTISKLSKEGHEIYVIFAAYRKYNNRINKKKIDLDKKKARKAKKILGYKKAIFLNLEDEALHMNFDILLSKLEKEINKIKPSHLFCCFSEDNNQDHRTVYDVARIIFRWTSGIENVYLYETPSSTEMSPSYQSNLFVPNLYIDIGNSINNKVSALRCYDNELKKFPHARSIDGIKTYAKFRGMSCGLDYAEAFMLLRYIIR